MLTKNELDKFSNKVREAPRMDDGGLDGSELAPPKALAGEDEVNELGPLQHLLGDWENGDTLPGRGWNMIALPFNTGTNTFNYRLLVNQYNEKLTFRKLGSPIPNRGLQGDDPNEGPDQLLAGLEYFQSVEQIASDDRIADAPFDPANKDAQLPDPLPDPQPSGIENITQDRPAKRGIHEEPGLWLHLANHTTDGLDIARMGSIPHGDTLLGLGTSAVIEGPPTIEDITGRPDIDELDAPYMTPYAFYNANPFKGIFDPVFPNRLLTQHNEGLDIVRSTVLAVNTTTQAAGILNIPFIIKEANATEMKFTFWINEMGDGSIQLQYSQTVFLDFHVRPDDPKKKKLIRWPHVSINTLVKTA